MADIAKQIAKDEEKPCLVRFVFDGPKPDAREDKEAVKPAMNSQSLKDAWGVKGRAIGDRVLCLCSRLYFPGRFNVDVSSLSREDSKEVNRLNAPILVVLGARKADGSREDEVLQGRILPNDAVAAMKRVVKEIEPGKLNARAQEFSKLVLEVESLKSQLALKQDMHSKRPSGKLEHDIEEFQGRIAKGEAQINELKDALLGMVKS